MDSFGHYFSEYSDSKKRKDWRKQYSDGSNRVLQLRFHQVIRCGSYGFALNYTYLPSFYVASFCENWIIAGRKLIFNRKKRGKRLREALKRTELPHFGHF